MTIQSQFISKNEQTKKEAIGLIHKVYLCYLKNSKNYTASTKTKSEVRGGGRKPWKQKGTGRARAGSLRSPLFVGGGVIFGPKPKKIVKKINKKEKRLALLSALTLKEKQISLIEDTIFDIFQEVKTKKVLNLLNDFKIEKTSKILIVLAKTNKFFWLSSRNLKNVEITTANCLNLEQILKASSILMSKQALNLINGTYGKHYIQS